MKKGKMIPYFGNHIWGSMRLFLCVAMAIFLMATAYKAQAETNPSTQAAKEAAKIGESETGFKAGSFILAPIPIQSPSIGTGLIVVGAYLFKTDKDSNTSFFGASGFRTNNGSQGYGMAGTISWDANRWSLGVVAGVADITYDFYVPNTGGRTVSLQQDGKLINLEGKYGITDNFSAGLEFRYLDTTVRFSSPIGTPGRDSNLQTIMIGPTLDWDMRDDTIYPTTGSHVSFSSLHGFVLNGTDREYHKTVIKYDNYIPLFERSVIATRFAACSASSSTPFFDLCSVGGTDSFRGFPFGQLLDKSLLSVQVEYRGRFNQRFGYTVFAGAGGVALNFSDFNSSSVQTAGGFGLRYRLSKKTLLDFSIDAAINSYGETTTYITIGQRF
jgi:outer membrane protein assembly factor BamA